MSQTRVFSVVLEPDAEVGGYTAIVPALPGVVTEGNTVEEALDNARDAVRLCLEDMFQQGVDVPPSDSGARLEHIEVPIAS